MSQPGDSDSRDRERLEAGMFAAAALADSLGIRFEDALALMIRAFIEHRLPGVLSDLDKGNSDET